MEDRFEIAVDGDLTASAITPDLDGNQAAQTNFRFISSHVYKIAEMADAIAKAKIDGTLKNNRQSGLGHI